MTFFETETGYGAHARAVDYAPLRTHPRHCHDTTTITLILAGALEEGTDTGTRLCGPLSVVVKPAGVYHENVYGPRGVRTFQLTLDARRTRDLFPVLEYGWHEGGPLARTLLAAYRLAADDALQDAIEMEGCIADALSAVHVPTGGAPVRDRWLDDLARALDEAAGPVSISAMADDLKLHPVSLARSSPNITHAR